MTRYVCAVGIVITLLAPHSATAQEALTLDSAVQAALAQNASLRAARAATDEAAARVTERDQDFFPASR